MLFNRDTWTCAHLSNAQSAGSVSALQHIQLNYQIQVISCQQQTSEWENNVFKVALGFSHTYSMVWKTTTTTSSEMHICEWWWERSVTLAGLAQGNRKATVAQTPTSYICGEQKSSSECTTRIYRFLKYSKQPTLWSVPLRSHISSFWCLICTITEALDLFLLSFIHCTDATWLTDCLTGYLHE